MFYRIGEKKGSLVKEQEESNHKKWISIAWT